MARMRPVYIAYPSSLTLQSANAVQTFHTAGLVAAARSSAVALIPRLPGRASAFKAIGATHLPRLPFNALNHLLCAPPPGPTWSEAGSPGSAPPGWPGAG